ncbi:MAG: cytochrome c3 family protein [bacterium]|nr:cytochrome c3 family protein [bacterium]MBU1917126.1 cytochrome c3 family protein [bacterium]
MDLSRATIQQRLEDVGDFLWEKAEDVQKHSSSLVAQVHYPLEKEVEELQARDIEKADEKDGGFWSFAQVTWGFLFGTVEPNNDYSFHATNDDPRTVTTQTDFKQVVAAEQPTDLLPLASNEFVVLDGHQNRLVFQNNRETPDKARYINLPNNESWGAPIRMTTRVHGGYWLAYPGNEEQAGRVIAIDETGQEIDNLQISSRQDNESEPHYLSPLCITEVDGDLVVGTRSGEVLRLDRTGDAYGWYAAYDLGLNGARFDMITDVVVSGDKIIAVDGGAQRIHVLNKDDGTHSHSFGSWGQWTGSLAQPRSVGVTSEGHLLVADAELDALQLYSLNGDYLGLATTGDHVLTLDHAVVVRSVPDQPTQFYALDEINSEVTYFTISKQTQDWATSFAASGESNLIRRTHLVDPHWGVSGDDGDGCYRCHDGFTTDSREIWEVMTDPDVHSHPFNVEPSFTLPEDIPLYGGLMACESCHMPHGDDGHMFMRIDSETGCLDCHTEEAHERAKEDDNKYTHAMGDLLEEKLSLRGDQDSMTLAAQLYGGCEFCHITSPHTASYEYLLQETDDGAPVCGVCHETRVSANQNHFMGISDASLMTMTTTSDVNPLDVSCTTCHSLTNGVNDQLFRSADEYTCLNCHEQQEEYKPLTPIEDARADGGERKRHSAIEHESEVMCLGCHLVHDDPESDWSLSWNSASTAITRGCMDCHGSSGDNPIETFRTSSGHPLHKRVGSDASCMRCHGDDEHNPEKRDFDNYRGTGFVNYNPASQPCLQCHDAFDVAPSGSRYQHKRIDDFIPGHVLFDHREITLFDNSGNQVSSNMSGAFTCLSCHVDYGSADRALANGILEFCGECHVRKGEAEGNFREFHQRAEK